jgi:hypothetical protein
MMHRGPRRDPDRVRACGCAGAGSAGRSAASGAPPCGGAAHRRGRSHRRSPRGAPRRQRPRRAGHRSAAARTTPRRPRESRRATHTPNQGVAPRSGPPRARAQRGHRRPRAAERRRPTVVPVRARDDTAWTDALERAGPDLAYVRRKQNELDVSVPSISFLGTRRTHAGAEPGPPGSSDRYPGGRSRSPLARYRRRGRTRVTRNAKTGQPVTELARRHIVTSTAHVGPSTPCAHLQMAPHAPRLVGSDAGP